MLWRMFVLLMVGLFVVALITRSRALVRTLWVLFGLAVIYTLLKATGAIEAIAPDRMGVF